MKLAGLICFWLRLLINFPIFDANVKAATSVVRTFIWDLFTLFV
jgi:hypothetical protein